MEAQLLESICGAWPGVTHSIKWEVDLVYSVAGKMFAVCCTIGTERGRVSFKVDTDRFLELTDQPGFMPAPYMARAFWVTVLDPRSLPPKQLEAFLRRSYELVVEKLPKKTQAALQSA
ncbi:MAG: MmcQ/YjbR family DNA-binding protein [Tahibacter sp.]